MARGDFKIVTPLSDVYTKTWLVDSGTTAQAKSGEPVKLDDAAGAETGEVSIMVDGDGTTSQRWAGVCKTDSTETTSAAGEVVVWMPLPGIIYSGKALTSTTFDTAAEIAALGCVRVLFDLTGTAWTIDAAANDAVVNCIVIVGGDHHTQTVHWMYRPSGTYLDFCISV